MISVLRFVAPVLVAATLLVQSGCDTGGACACSSAGAVLFDVTSVSSTADSVFVTAKVEWQPCCKDFPNETRTYSVSAADGKTAQASVPADATEVAAPTGTEPYVVPFVDLGTSVRIDRSSSDGIGTPMLVIGEVRKQADDTFVADIAVDVKQ